jgi:hypothetical protein
MRAIDLAVRLAVEPAVADESADDAGEGEEVLGFALVASVETAAAGEPGHGAFDGPAVTAQPLGGFDALAAMRCLGRAFGAQAGGVRATTRPRATSVGDPEAESAACFGSTSGRTGNSSGGGVAGSFFDAAFRAVISL